ncbi:MAG: hypothetical protein WBG57_08120 [Ornithinimicrobium sp.]
MARRDHRAFEIAGQHGLATRAQLIRAGWTYSAIRHGLATTWGQPAPGVFLTHRGGLTPRQRLICGALWAGHGAVLTGAAALHIYRATEASPDRSDFVVAQTASRSRSCAVATLHRTISPPDIAHWSGPAAVASPARALVDHARWTSTTSRDLEALTIACLQRRVTTPDLLNAALATAGRRGQGPVRRGLRSYRDGAWSQPEKCLRAMMRSQDLPPAVWNHKLRSAEGGLIGIPDVYVPTVGVAIQVHSRRYHDGWDREGNDLWSDTVQGDNRYTAMGIAVVGVTPATLSTSPHTLLGQLTQLCAQRSAIPPPEVQVECPDGCDSIDSHASLTPHSTRR